MTALGDKSKPNTVMLPLASREKATFLVLMEHPSRLSTEPILTEESDDSSMTIDLC